MSAPHPPLPVWLRVNVCGWHLHAFPLGQIPAEHATVSFNDILHPTAGTTLRPQRAGRSSKNPWPYLTPAMPPPVFYNLRLGLPRYPAFARRPPVVGATLRRQPSKRSGQGATGQRPDLSSARSGLCTDRVRVFVHYPSGCGSNQAGRSNPPIAAHGRMLG